MSPTKRFSRNWPYLLLPLCLGMAVIWLGRTRETAGPSVSSPNGQRAFAFETQPMATSAKPRTVANDSSQIVTPTVNAHTLAHHSLARGIARVGRWLSYHPGPKIDGSIATAAMDTEPSGSTLLVAVGRGNIAAFTQVPTDNMGNLPYRQLGPIHSYEPHYPASGTALYALPSAKGGRGHIVTAKTPATDEITVAAVEIQDGGVIQDYKWNKVLKGQPLTSLNVITTGPATLVAFWWGDGNESIAHVAIPNNGFKVIDALLSTGLLVQAAMATKDVMEAGSYSVTWDSAGQEGAHLYLVAVQNAPKPALPAPVR